MQATAFARRSLAGDYLALTKPSILLLVLVTGLPALLLAQGAPVAPFRALAALLGTALASAGAGALNHYIDRDIDAIMARTRRRPLPAGRVPPRQALWFGLALAALGTSVLGIWTTWTAAAIALGSIAYYTLLYTLWLKRRTPQNIVIGGAAGASAPLICWAAMTGSVGLPAWVMFAIVFLWTPPHFWSLAIFRTADYAAAGVPMLPVVAGEQSTKLQILLYTAVLIPTSLVPVALGSSGPLYASVALLLGAAFSVRAWRVFRAGLPGDCLSLFGFSIVYLLVLFGAMSVDVLVSSLSRV